MNNKKIRTDIKNYYKTQPCVICGSKLNIICCYKNNLNNLNMSIQTINDFHSLCNNHYLEKCKITNNTIKTNIRFGATNIPSLKIFNIDFISGDETFDKNDPNALVGTYWYDPVEFMNYIYKQN